MSLWDLAIAVLLWAAIAAGIMAITWRGGKEPGEH
jgi:hypothetical protein